jgi:hypothetical protein
MNVSDKFGIGKERKRYVIAGMWLCPPRGFDLCWHQEVLADMLAAGLQESWSHG